jgi:hypothetical protein
VGGRGERAVGGGRLVAGWAWRLHALANFEESGLRSWRRGAGGWLGAPPPVRGFQGTPHASSPCTVPGLPSPFHLPKPRVTLEKLGGGERRGGKERGESGEGKARGREERERDELQRIPTGRLLEGAGKDGNVAQVFQQSGGDNVLGPRLRVAAQDEVGRGWGACIVRPCRGGQGGLGVVLRRKDAHGAGGPAEAAKDSTRSRPDQHVGHWRDVSGLQATYLLSKISGAT